MMEAKQIHEIELSSVCNLACKYCPHPKLQRAKEHMSYEVFLRTMEHVAYFCKKGTQGELSITGIGEAILHPYLDTALGLCRQTIESRPLVLATNGVALTDEIAAILKKWEVIVYVSNHRPEKAGEAIDRLEKHQVIHGLNHAFVDDSLDWAGQVDWHVSAKSRDCTYLSDQWVVVRQDGSINACCMDAHSKYPIAHVNDELGSIKVRPIELCRTCHLTVPTSMKEAV